MRRYLLSCLSLFVVAFVYAQTADPVIMTINGKEIPRSEYEYSYNKNNTSTTIDKKSVEEYVELFVNYKLKVEAALDARMDTAQAFDKEFRSYRDQLVRNAIVNDEDVLAEAHRIYDRTKANIGERGLIRPAHIFLRLGQRDSIDKQQRAEERADSIYKALLAGGDFEDIARKYSEDKRSAVNGGLLPWISVNQSLKEFEDAAFALKVGEMSKPVLSPAGYHIILMKDRKQLEPFDSLKSSIYDFIEKRNIRDGIANKKIIAEVERSGNGATMNSVMDARADSLMAADMDARYLIGEYHDGLLLYEISTREVWDKAQNDTLGLGNYFKKNKKKYTVEVKKSNGKIKKRKAKDYNEVKGLVVADYQKLLETEWVGELRRKYDVVVYEDVVKTVNNH